MTNKNQKIDRVVGSTRKKGTVKNLTHGRAYVTATFNNTLVNITDDMGGTVVWGSAGASGFKGARKSTPYAATTAVEKVAAKAKEKGISLPKISYGKFPVFGRRFGKFKPIGMGRTEREAFSLGKEFARTTLGVTFKIPGVSGRKLPGYKTKYTKQGVFYIEPRGKRLKKRGISKEVSEIQLYRGLKRRK